MNRTKLLLDVRETSNYIGMSLLPALGPPALSNNYMGIICNTLESILNPYDKSIAHFEELKSYGISDDKADEILAGFMSAYMRVLREAFDDAIYNHIFKVLPLAASTVQIEKQTEGIRVTFDFDFSQVNANGRSYDADCIRADVAAGHFVPPRERRLVGL